MGLITDAQKAFNKTKEGDSLTKELYKLCVLNHWTEFDFVKARYDTRLKAFIKQQERTKK